MADDIAITAGAGTAVATDDIGGRHFQRVKVALGADGTAVDALAGAGSVGTGVQRMTLASDDPAVVALQLLDNAHETNRLAVNLIASQVGIAAGAGPEGATVIRTTEANDRPGKFFNLTPAVDSAATALNDVLWIPTEIDGAAHHANGMVEIRSLTIVDESDSGPAIDIYFATSSASQGALNAAWAPTDANSLDTCARVQIVAADWEDYGAGKRAFIDNVGQCVLADANADIWCYGVARTAVTLGSTSAIKLKIGLVRF